MFGVLLMLLALYAACLMITFKVDVHHFDVTRARVRLHIAGIHKTWQLILLRTAQGHRLVLTDEGGIRPVNTGQLRQSRGAVLLDALRRADKARSFLLRHVIVDGLDGLILLRTEDAARSAILTGGLRALLCAIPAVRRRKVRIRVLPDFFRAHSTVDARCIIRVRVGTIILTAGMLFLAYLREQRLRESEAM